MTTRFTKLGLGPTAGKRTPALALHELWRFVCGSIWEYALFAGRHFCRGSDANETKCRSNNSFLFNCDEFCWQSRAHFKE